jgi:hypothetical protein
MNLTMMKRCVATGVVALAACTGEGSLGAYPESSGTADDDGASDESGSGSATGSDTMVGDGTDTSATDDDSTGSSSGTGSVAMCEQPGNCSEYSPCDDANLCGTLDSLFDENGCVRQECQDDDGCADDERCYLAQDFGGCAPSGVFCEDDPELQTCLCGSDPQCGGGFCVPQSLYPSTSTLPLGVTFATATCASLGAIELYLQWGGFGECDLDEPLLALWLFNAGPDKPFEYDMGSQPIGWYTASDNTQVEVLHIEGELVQYDDDTVAGVLEATLAPNADGVQIIAGEFEMPMCGEIPPCI